MSYTGIGRAFGANDCPGQEKWDETIGACMCPPGTAPDLMSTGKCVSPAASEASFKKWKGEVGTCKPYVAGQGMCLCPAGTAYDELRDMCTAEQLAKGYLEAAKYGVKKPCPSGFILDAWDPNLPCIPDPRAKQPGGRVTPPPEVIVPPSGPQEPPTKPASTIFGLPTWVAIAGIAGVGLLGVAVARQKAMKK